MPRPMFVGCVSEMISRSFPALFGAPLDVTSTFRHGSDSAPRAIREASDSIETFSPFLNRDLTDRPFADIGDLDLTGLAPAAALDVITSATTDILDQGAKPVCLGGEHLITLGIVRALKDVPDLMVLQLDAHTDLREDYEGLTLNHATVMKRIADLLGPHSLTQLGIRSGTRDEFVWMSDYRTLIKWGPGAEKCVRNRIGTRPVYVTIDLDVLDPSLMPATGNPEAGGWMYEDMQRFLDVSLKLNIIGADIVELNPQLDPTLVSTITAAKIVREMILILQG